MRIPNQAQPAMRNTVKAAMESSNSVNPSWSFGSIINDIGNAIGGVIKHVDPICAVECAGALASCGFSPTCLIQNGMSKCVKCIK